MRIIIFTGVLLFLQFSIHSQVKVDANNHLSINHNEAQIGSASFTLSEVNEGYGGMYINSKATNLKWPFYGYATDNFPVAWHYFDNSKDSWNLNVGGIDRWSVSSDTSWVINQLVGQKNMRLVGGLTIGSPSAPTIKMNASDGLLINTSQRFNSFTDLTLNSNSNTFAGMMINVNDANAGKPFYGYAINGEEQAFTFFEPINKSLNTFVGDENTTANITEAQQYLFRINGNLLINAESQFNPFTDFTLKSKSPTFGGMYVDVDGLGSGKPFYGYALNGSELAYHYYDEFLGVWRLSVTNSTAGQNVILTAGPDFLSIDGYLVLNNDEVHPNSSVGPAGTIYYKDGHFYGKVSGNTFRQLDNETNAANLKDDSVILQELKLENEKLRQEIDHIKQQLLEVAQKVESIQAQKN